MPARDNYGRRLVFFARMTEVDLALEHFIDSELGRLGLYLKFERYPRLFFLHPNVLNVRAEAFEIGEAVVEFSFLTRCNLSASL